MNKVILMGRLTRDPEIRYTQGENQTCVARYTLAVDRRFKQEGQQSADFIGCVAFGRAAEFAEKYFRQGTKIAVTGRIQNRKLYKQRGTKGIHNRRCNRGSGVCGKQSSGSGKQRKRCRAAGTATGDGQ